MCGCTSVRAQWDKDVLLDKDFHQLGKASAIDQQLWVAEMEASITAASQGNAPTKASSNEPNSATEGTSNTQQAKPIDMTGEKGSEGSGAWKRQQWR